MADEFDERPVRSSKTPWVLWLLTLAAAGAAGYFGFKEWNHERNEVKGLRDRVGELERTAASTKDGREALQAKLDVLEKEKIDLLAAKNDLNREVQAKEEELQRLKGTFDKLQDKMKAEIKKGEIQLSQVGGKLRVDLVDKVLFESGEAEISERGKEVLSRVGQVLSSIDDKLIQVSGHTDDSPITLDKLKERFPTNWELSTARAVNVVRFLQEKAQVTAKRMVAAGYSQYHPVGTNANPVGRARNRRIEILLTPDLESKPAPPPPPGKKPEVKPVKTK